MTTIGYIFETIIVIWGFLLCNIIFFVSYVKKSQYLVRKFKILSYQILYNTIDTPFIYGEEYT